MDEPASALDPISTTRIEDLMHELKRDYTIVIVTHNMQQAARVADMTAFFSVEVDEASGKRTGVLVEYDRTDEDLHDAGRPAHRGLRDGPVRLDAHLLPGRAGRARAVAARRERARAPLAARRRRGGCAQDVELADEVIAFDDDVDAQYFEVEQGIELLLARQTPVASDLRLVLAMLKDNLHLERMGDLCVTIAKLTKLTKGLPPDETLLDGFREMGERAEQMIRVALRSLEQRDRIAAESLLELDELIDRANRRIVNRLLDVGHELEQREWGLRMILVSRCLERIGDHAVDIGEQTAYLVTGEFREFTDASHP